MLYVKVTITTPNGEVLEEFVAAPHNGGELSELQLSANVRDKLSQKFNVADDYDDLLDARGDDYITR